MSNLDKMASACANVFLGSIGINKSAGTEGLRAMELGDATRKAFQENSRAIAGKGGLENWMKILLGIGGGKMLLDRQDQTKGDWR